MQSVGIELATSGFQKSIYIVELENQNFENKIKIFWISSKSSVFY